MATTRSTKNKVIKKMQNEQLHWAGNKAEAEEMAENWAKKGYKTKVVKVSLVPEGKSFRKSLGADYTVQLRRE